MAHDMLALLQIVILIKLQNCYLSLIRTYEGTNEY